MLDAIFTPIKQLTIKFRMYFCLPERSCLIPNSKRSLPPYPRIPYFVALAGYAPDLLDKRTSPNRPAVTFHSSSRNTFVPHTIISINPASICSFVCNNSFINSLVHSQTKLMIQTQFYSYALKRRMTIQTMVIKSVTLV